MADPENEKTRFTRGHRWLTTVNLLVAVLAVLAMGVMLNYVAEGHFRRFQWANFTSLKLSPQTMRVLDSLTNDVKVTVFYTREQEEDTFTMVWGLLTEYQNASRHIKVLGLDYVRSPHEAGVMLNHLHFSGPGSPKDFVVFESGGHSKICYARDLSDYDLHDLLTGKSRNVRRTSFLGERFFSSAIFAVSYPSELKAYFLATEGSDQDPGDPLGLGPKPPASGYSKLAGILKDEINCKWERLSLAGTNGIPADCKLLIIASPRKSNARLTSNEVAQINDYLEQHDGRLLALLNPDQGLDPVLARWGVGLGPVRVIDYDRNVWNGKTPDFLAYPAGDREHPIHPIVKSLVTEKLLLHMVAPFPVVLTAPPSRAPGAPTVTPLVGTSTNGAQLTTNSPKRGVFALAYAIEKGAINGKDGTRLVVSGDAEFLDDQLIDGEAANHYFAEKTLEWLLQRPEILLTGLGPRPISEYKLFFTDRQMTQVKWLFLGAMPGAILFLGALVWLRRRS